MKTIVAFAFAFALTLFGGTLFGGTLFGDTAFSGTVAAQPNMNQTIDRAILQAMPSAASASRSMGRPMGSRAAWARTSSVERIHLVDDIAQYRFRLQIGRGTHDVIRLHRIVRERAPWRPVRRARGVLLAHGDAWGFEPTFLNSVATLAVDDERNIAVFLAARGLDVWGVDFRWALVPGDTADLSFMADWGWATSLEDLDAALGVSRFVRLMTGSGFGRMTLIGFSRGGQLGWAHLGDETARPQAFRHVGAFVAVDHTFKVDDEAVRQSGCDAAVAVAAQIAGGEIATEFSIVTQIGDAALADPAAPSPIFSALSNADLAEFIGADLAGGAIPNLHSVGGVIDETTLATELLHSEPEHWFTFLARVSPFQPLGIDLDGAELLCDEVDSPFDDRLDQIAVPILYIGSLGGFGQFGVATTTRVASTDVSTILVDVPPTPAQGFGHNDHFLAAEAPAEVWQPIYDWIDQR